jgi:hypothetical protein
MSEDTALSCFLMEHVCFAEAPGCFGVAQGCFAMEQGCFVMTQGCFALDPVCFPIVQGSFVMAQLAPMPPKVCPVRNLIESVRPKRSCIPAGLIHTSAVT